MNYVQVRGSTQTSTGTVLPPVFAGSLVPGFKGATIGACARVAFGPADAISNVSGHALLALPTEACVFPSTLTAPTVWPATDQIIMLQDTAGCGGFGWMTNPSPSAGCTTTVNYLANVSMNFTNTITTACMTAISNAQARPSSPANTSYILLPIYSSLSHSGGTPHVTLAGVAAFVITGYRLGTGFGQTQQSWLSGKNSCGTGGGSSPRCLFGYFVGPVSMVDVNAKAGTTTQPNFGVNVFQTVG